MAARPLDLSVGERPNGINRPFRARRCGPGGVDPGAPCAGPARVERGSLGLHPLVDSAAGAWSHCHQVPNAGSRLSVATAGARVVTTAAVAALVVATGGSAAAQSASGPVAWTVSSGEVGVRCRLTVGGSFDAVTSALSGTLRGGPPGAFEGQLQVDLASLDTGIGLRDEHLRGSYLEIDRGPAFRHAVLSAIALREPLPAGRGRHETAFSGRLTLHGVDRTVEGEAALERRGGRMRVAATLRLSLEAFDIPPPRYLGVGVRDEIRITVAFKAAPSGAAPENGP